MDWATIKYYLFREKAFQVSVISSNGKIVEKFVAAKMEHGPKNRIFRLFDRRTIKVSNGLDCVVKQVWRYKGKIVKE